MTKLQDFQGLVVSKFFFLNEAICKGYWEIALWVRVIVFHKKSGKTYPVSGFLDHTAEENRDSVHCYDVHDYIYIPMSEVEIVSTEKKKNWINQVIGYEKSS